ncbi:ATP-binding protein [Actinoallomurus sp. NPDC050550]|uniref:ATP-binding protein n=1 Tax=Actinoallomurus sp. NPDC050550 TaxID=3154937 RepID=UPI00340F5F7E
MDVYPVGCELVWRRAFPGIAEHAHSAREFVAFLLADMPVLDDAVLVTGEFVANALRHTASARPDGRFIVEVRRRPDSATIALTDQGGPKEPTIPNVDDMSECGRGLYMVRALASELTWSGSHAGRTFTATLKDGSR